MKYSDIIKKAWKDPKFKEELYKNPKEVLVKEGIEIPQETQVFIHENTDKEFHFILPKKPEGSLTEDELSEDQLESIAGGANHNWFGDIGSGRKTTTPAGKGIQAGGGE